MKFYCQNGTISEKEYSMQENELFAIQIDNNDGREQFSYPGKTLIQKLDLELVNLADEFVKLYFPNYELYYREASLLPLGLSFGGHNSDIPINKAEFVSLVSQYISRCRNLYRHLYVEDCKYLLCTMQNLLFAAEHFYLQYFIRITEINCEFWDLGQELMICSDESMQLLSYIETFFIKLYSVLDLIVKIIYELENPVETFNNITKLKSSGKLWGDRKKLLAPKGVGTIFEDCETVRIVEALRNEAVHNGTWEFRPKVFLKHKDRKIVERYMLFPDFVEGRLSSVKNRKHFFSTGTTVNDMLVLVHDDFYKRLLATLESIKLNRN